MNILDFGAVPNTGRLYTKEIQAALDAATDRNGATVVIPAGEFITGTLNLGSASLYLEKGAILKGSPNIEDYVFNGFMHAELGETLSLLYSLHHSDIQISGEGTIDLNGKSFFHMDQPNVPHSAVPFTEKQKEECTRLFDKRPTQPIFFYDCKRVSVQGIKIIEAPCWTLTFSECEEVRVSGITIDNSLSIPNNDGIHFCSCKSVFVRDCYISCGDDCIALTAITDWSKPCEDVVISDCILRSCSKAIVAGYMHSIVRNVTINNCIVKESNRAFAIMTSAHTGLVENIQVSNLRLDTRIRAGNWWGNGEAVCIMSTRSHSTAFPYIPPAHHDFPISVRNVSFQNLVCTTENVLAIIGEDDSVSNVRLSGLTVELKDSENLMLKGRMVDMSPSKQIAFLPDDEPYWLHIQGVRDVSIDNAYIAPYHGKQPQISQKDCRNIHIQTQADSE
jgi:polygalacturonase